MTRALGEWVTFLIFLGLLVTGCAAPPERMLLADWTLVSEGVRTPVHLPVHVTKLVPDHPSEFRLEATAKLPADARGKPWVFGIPFLAGHTTLLVNGELAPSLETNLLHGYRAYSPQTYFLDPRMTATGELALVVTVHSTWTQATFLDTLPRLYRYGDRDPGIGLARFANGELATIACTAIFVMGLTYLAVYFTDRNRRAYLWAGLQSTLGAYYAFYITGGSQVGIGHIEANTEAIALIVAPIAGVYFSHAIFSLPRPSRAWLVLGAISAIPPLFVYDPFVIAHWVFGSVVCVAVVVVYQAFVCIQLLRKPDPPVGAAVLLVAWLFLGVASGTDLLGWLGQGDLIGGARGGPLGLGVFGVLQALLLSRQHSQSMREGDALNVQLQHRVSLLEKRERDVRQLNDELRRQIGDRSRQLFTALAAIGGRGAVSPELTDGTTIEGRYLVVRKIGSGGMGTVYEVQRVLDGQRLALKVAQTKRGLDLSRLAREAHLASRVAHPNVVGVLDVDVATEGFLYIVLEYVDAPSLGELRGTRFDVPFASRVLLQIARGLAALHEAGIVHRDLKPENVLVLRPGTGPIEVKLLDFGISRDVDPAALLTKPFDAAPDDVSVQAGPTDETRQVMRTPSVPSTPSTPSQPELTQAGAICGTPRYIAPEMADAGDRLSPAADVFAFGVLAFELFTTAPPFDIPPIVMRLGGCAVPVPPRLGKERPDVPPSLATLIDDCLSIDPAHRPTVRQIMATITALG